MIEMNEVPQTAANGVGPMPLLWQFSQQNLRKRQKRPTETPTVRSSQAPVGAWRIASG
jgi:hypothetical protein